MLPDFRVRRFLVRLVWVVSALCLLPLLPAQAAEGQATQSGKKAILLVSFGTSVASAQKVFDKIDAATKARFLGWEVRWAFTSKKIRQKLATQGKVTLSPQLALAALADDGFDRVAIQSLHIIPGEEFEGLQEVASRLEGMPKGLKQVEVGMPLLESREDRQRAAQAMLAHAPAERRPDEALVYMGHGTPHSANWIYSAMVDLFQKQDPKVFVALVDGKPELASVQRELLAQNIKKAWLLPLMSVAGEHAHNDMAGRSEDSWTTKLGKAGIACQPVFLGMAEYPEIIDIWLDHLQVAVNKVDKEAAKDAAKAAAKKDDKDEADKGWGVELVLPMYSKYVSRGALTVNDPVLQPGATLSGYGFTFNVWGNYNLTDAINRKGRFNEVDLTGEYAYKLGDFSFPVGVSHYLYPSMSQPSTTEVYAGVSYEALITPTLKVYQDVGDVHGQLAALTLAYNQELYRNRPRATVSLNLTAGVDWGSNDYNKYRYNWGVDGDRLIDANFTVGLPCKLIDSVTITPSYTHVILLDSAIKDAAGYDSKGFWGFSVSWAF